MYPLFINPSISSDAKLRIPESIAVVTPRKLSGLFLKPLWAWDHLQGTFEFRCDTSWYITPIFCFAKVFMISITLNWAVESSDSTACTKANSHVASTDSA